MACIKECEELGDIKAVIRAILVADKDPPTLRHFLGDYKRSEGVEFPYQRFGFTSAVAFLRSMPDTVMLQQIGARDVDVRLIPTITRDILHVQKLVSGQKDPLGRCSRQERVFQPVILGSSTLSPPPPQPCDFQPVNLGSSRLPSPPPQPKVVQRPLAPRQLYSASAAVLARIKQNVRVLLQDNCNGLDTGCFTRAYQQKFGCILHFVPFGCNSLEEFVSQKLNDTARVEWDSTGASRVTLLQDGGGPPAPPARRPVPVHPGPPVPGQALRTAMGTPVRQPVQPWMQRAHNTYRAYPALTIRRSPSPQSPIEGEEDWELEVASPAVSDNKDKRPEDKPSPALDILAGDGTQMSRPSPLNGQVVSNIEKVVDSQPDGLCLSEFNEVCRPHSAEEPPRSGHQQCRQPQGPPLDLKHMVAVIEKILRGNHLVLPQGGRARGWRSRSTIRQPGATTGNHLVLPQGGRARGWRPRSTIRQPGATMPGGSGGLALDALLKAFAEVTGHRLDPLEYGFTAESFVSFLCYALPAKWERLEPSGQFLIMLEESEQRRPPGTVATVPHNGAAAGAPRGGEQEADLLASLPQPKRPPRCDPHNLWGFIQPDQRQGLATGQLVESALQPPVVPELLARRTIPYQPCLPTDCESEEESGAQLSQSSAPQPPAAAGGPGGLHLPGSEPVGQPRSLQAVGDAPPPVFPVVPPICSCPLQVRHGPVHQSCLVRVLRICSPHHFYVQCMDEGTAHTLHWLATHLEAACRGWYNKANQIDVQSLTVGMPCVAPYTLSDGETSWLRGIVKALDAHDERCAQVFFVDYGYISRVPKTDLHELKNKFASIPAQAINATMGHLRPVGGVWSPDATQTFIRLLGKDYTVMCTFLERLGSTCSVHLCNTYVDPEVHIPDALVKFGHAFSLLGVEEVAHLLSLVESAQAASTPSWPSPAEWKTLFPAPFQGPASPPLSHAVEPDHGISASDVLRHHLEDWQVVSEHWGSEGEGEPVEPAELGAELLPGLVQSPSPREPGFSLLPLTSGDNFQGQLGALRSTLRSTARQQEEQPEEDATELPFCPEPVVQPLGEDFRQHLRALREMPSTVSGAADAQSVVHGSQDATWSPALVPAFREASSGRRPPGWRSSPSPSGSPSAEPSWPSTGGALRPLPVDLELDAHPRPAPVSLPGSGAPEGAAWQPTALPSLPPQEEEEEEEGPTWRNNPINWPEPGLHTLYPHCAVKLEPLSSGHCLAVVNLQQEPYVTSANVCQLLGWPFDTLGQELQAMRVTFRTMTLKWDECVRFFLQMASFHVPGVEGPITLAPEVTFFRLDNVNDLLSLFGNTDFTLAAEVTRVLQAFDPASTYWTEDPPFLGAGASADPGAGSR